MTNLSQYSDDNPIIELDRLRIGIDGKRRVVLRRKIIRQPQPLFWLAG